MRSPAANGQGPRSFPAAACRPCLRDEQNAPLPSGKRRVPFCAVHAHAANADIPPGRPGYKKAGARLLPATGDHP
ncbi:hypothetical protein DESPIG_02903 [Desulfovibrio piger ATCC 29098]|uniref:Uncharacterized protein n=1 Tax=Desulfovibrio piger ATCC 29098 TaxID=411464 RepID=B6WXS3_9BACT|nr:hypothetical protein DESPIG_02903 [Desulfovibrio piger ATCC 29098]